MVSRNLSIVISLRDEEFAAEVERSMASLQAKRSRSVALRDVRGRFQSVDQFKAIVMAAAVSSMAKAAEVVRLKVVNRTPLWRGRLRRGVTIEDRRGGMDQVVYGDGVVFKTHELNGQWSQMPPHQPIAQWVRGKLGVSGKEAHRVAWAVQRKIKREGLTLPNIEGMGQMIQRTKDEMERNDFHFKAFARAFKDELRRI